MCAKKHMPMVAFAAGRCVMDAVGKEKNRATRTLIGPKRWPEPLRFADLTSKQAR
jgi:hypothetical protein